MKPVLLPNCGDVTEELAKGLRHHSEPDHSGAQRKAQHLDATSPDLAGLIALWPGLPSEVQAQILRLAQQAHSAAESPR